MPERLTFNHGAAVFAPQMYGHRDREARAGAPPTVRSQPVNERADLAYWSVFVFTALLFFRPQDMLPALAPLHLPEISAVVAIAAMAIRRVTRGLPPIPATPELWALAAFAATMVVTAPFSIWPSGAIHTFTDLFAKVVLVFMVLTHALASPRRLHRFMWLIIVAMGYLALRGVFDYARGVNLIEGRLQGAVSGLMGNPNDLALNMVTFLPFALFVALSRGGRLPRLLAAAAGTLMVATILFAKSRAGFLGLAVVGILIVLQMIRMRPAVGLTLLVGVLAVTPLLPGSVWTRASSIIYAADDETGSREARVQLMHEAWGTFLAHPLTGVGAGQFQNYDPEGRVEPWREAHSVGLQVLAELGILGGLTFGYLLLRSIAALWSTWRKFPVRRAGKPAARRSAAATLDAFDPQEYEWMRLHVSACVAALGGWLVCAQFGSVGYYWTLYYVLALIVAGREVTTRATTQAVRPAARAAAS